MGERGQVEVWVGTGAGHAASPPARPAQGATGHSQGGGGIGHLVTAIYSRQVKEGKEVCLEGALHQLGGGVGDWVECGMRVRVGAWWACHPPARPRHPPEGTMCWMAALFTSTSSRPYLPTTFGVGERGGGGGCACCHHAHAHACTLPLSPMHTHTLSTTSLHAPSPWLRSVGSSSTCALSGRGSESAAGSSSSEQRQPPSSAPARGLHPTHLGALLLQLALGVLGILQIGWLGGDQLGKWVAGGRAGG